VKTRIRRNVRHALGMQPRDLMALWKLLRRSYTKVEVSAQCADGSILETQDIDELLGLDNPTFRRIQTIEISARTSYEDRLSLDLGESTGSTAQLRIESENDTGALHLASEIVNLLREARPRYSPVARYKASFILAGVWVCSAVWASLNRVVGTSPPSPADRLSAVDLLNLSVFVGAVFLLVVWPIDTLQRWLFPRLFFGIGRQADEWSLRRRWRSIVFVGFGLSVLASLVAAFLFERLK